MIIQVEVIASVAGAICGCVLGLRRYPRDLMKTLKGRLPDVFLLHVLLMMGAFALGCVCWTFSVPAMLLASAAAIAFFFYGGNRLAYLARL